MITRSDPPAQKKTLAIAPFQKLEKPSSKDGALKHHHKMQCHQRALDAGVALVQSAKNRRKPRDLGISTQNQGMFDKNTNVARVIISAIILCGK